MIGCYKLIDKNGEETDIKVNSEKELYDKYYVTEASKEKNVDISKMNFSPVYEKENIKMFNSIKEIIEKKIIEDLKVSEIIHEKIFGFIETWLKTHPYDIVFYVPKNNELLQKYGKKDKSEEYLNEIEEKYMEILKKLNINYIVLPKNQDEQVDYIVKYLKNLAEVKESE